MDLAAADNVFKAEWLAVKEVVNVRLRKHFFQSYQRCEKEQIRNSERNVVFERSQQATKNKSNGKT